MLDKATAINTVRRYADEVKKEFSPSSIIMFGSYVNGTPNEDSDIDVAVIFNGFSGDWWDASARLWGITENVSFDIEPHLLDITKDKSGFVKYVMHTGQVIYQA